jgi:hypothetical protein
MIELWIHPQRALPRYRYRLAGGQAVTLDHRFPALEPFRVDPPAAATAAPPVPWETLRAGQQLHAARGWLGGQWRRVRAVRSAAATLLDIAGFGEVAVLDGGGIVMAAETSAAAEELTLEIAAGPALLLALARTGIFALHAGAFLPAGLPAESSPHAGAIVLCGDSGTGKSTLAAAAEQAGGQRLADDILPLAIPLAGPLAIAGGSGVPAAAPHFPQLKLAAGEQYGRGQPPLVPLAAIYLLASLPADDRNPGHQQAWPQIERLTPRDALLALVSHTVAARLFDPPRHAALMDTLVQLTGQTPVLRLRFARRPSLLSALLRAIARPPPLLFTI